MAPAQDNILREVFACGNLSIKSKSNSLLKVKGYNTIDLDLLNLDGEFKEDRRIISCVVPKNFKEIPDERGFKRLPSYNLMPFRLRAVTAEKIDFKTQMFYQDPLQNNRKILFLHGRKVSSGTKSQSID